MNRSIFFFQAEDGIRDVAVTGVQTCALPISLGVYLLRLGGLLDDLAAGLLPLHLYRNNHRETAAPPLFRPNRWLVRRPVVHRGTSVKSTYSSYITSLVLSYRPALLDRKSVV